MVAYSFQARFAEPILSGTKGGTIRAARKAAFGGRGRIDRYRAEHFGGHAGPCEEMQLYTGMRTRQCRLIASRKCFDVEPIELNFYLRKVFFPKRLVTIEGRALNLFARFDGFVDFDEMADFWKTDQFDGGWHIRWLPLPDFGDG